MDLPYKKFTVVAVVGLSLMIVLGILCWEKYERDQTTETRGKRSVKISDYCLLYYGGIELTYVRGSPTAFQFDLCSVISCGRYPTAWRGYDRYLCGYYVFNDMCLRNQHSPSMCSTWGDVGASTDPHWLPSTPRGMDPRWQKGQGQRYVYLVLGVDASGTDPMGVVKINLVDPPPLNQTHTTTLAVPPGKPAPDTNTGVPGTVLALGYSKITTTDVVQLATGYGDKNLWLDWLIGTAKERGMEDSVACSTPRPLLFTEPAPLYPDADQWALTLISGLSLYVGTH
ncbi:uncharacterized protein LOC113127221 [Mastacembelus armatus]|uniref:uncharacterized protein LOC113127221 n=1 Tax=Mastacembelus armatus TaxID=205130 RepID=UPI000E45B17F|nr:uncharacterized protein LOC113127221 [Mastacembelus armatus]